MRFLAVLFLAFFLSVFVSAQSNKKSPAGTFSVTSLEGKTFDLAKLKGKVVVLLFWSTRCPICQSEISKFNRFAESFKDKDVVFLALTNENEVRVQNFLKKNPFVFNIIPNSLETLLKYADRDSKGNLSLSYPTHFLINQEGGIELKTNVSNKIKMLTSEIERLLKSEQVKAE